MKNIFYLILLILAIVLSGCESSNNHGYGNTGAFYNTILGFVIDERSPTALQDIDGAFLSAIECLGYQAYMIPPIVVIFVDEIAENPTLHGVFYDSPNLIIIKANNDLALSNYLTLEHEFVHYALYYITGDNDKNHTNSCYS